MERDDFSLCCVRMSHMYGEISALITALYTLIDRLLSPSEAFWHTICLYIRLVNGSPPGGQEASS